jgi:DNA-directed RNA polymerase subunit omega
VNDLPIEELMDRVGSRFSLVVAAAKRARQLKDGAVPLVRCDSDNPLTIALHEIAAGKVVVKPPGEPGDEPAIEVREPLPAEAQAAAFDLADELQEGEDEDLEDEDFEEEDLEDEDIEDEEG